RAGAIPACAGSTGADLGFPVQRKRVLLAFQESGISDFLLLGDGVFVWLAHLPNLRLLAALLQPRRGGACGVPSVGKGRRWDGRWRRVRPSWSVGCQECSCVSKVKPCSLLVW